MMALALPASAQDMAAFRSGPVFEGFAPHAPVEAAAELPDGTTFAVAFDVAEAADADKRNRQIESAARFLNMHVANGVEREDIRLAVVVHGGASMDLLTDAAWQADGRGATNPSAAMIRAMLDAGIRVILCGQSGAAHGLVASDLIPGVETALSAMTAHAVLQGEGYTVNPF
ncbi:hypothetical protein ELI_10435 [Erythrobacter litoralis HTCC2594]|uniref:Uncharacterized protein n=2 Tax=Erythrobacter litoralis TaxID=39960 RepID=Q2N812_ERYLH|nr:hypothetical protein ELI_10435 [Erythrobacter litoralis HTCC2594]